MSKPAYPLEGVRVVDLTQYVAGPYATLVLADLGAHVIKVERPGGDVYRRQGPIFLKGEAAAFLTLNRGKKSIVLDLGDPDDLERFHDLLADADVLVENSRPDSLKRFGLDWPAVHQRHPRLIYLSISGFGQQGPDAGLGGYDLTIQALSGLMAMTGHPGQPPAKVPIAALDFGTGLYGVVGVLAALRARDHTGEGEWVTTSILETALAWLSMHIVTMKLGGGVPEQLGTRSPFFAPYEAYCTEDGYLVVVGTGGADGWGDLCRALGLEQLYSDERFATNGDRVKNADALREEIEAVMKTRTSLDWSERLNALGVPNAPVQRLDQVLQSEQVVALRVVGSQSHPVAGDVPTVRMPVTLSAHRTTACEPPPLLDQHRNELLV